MSDRWEADAEELRKRERVADQVDSTLSRNEQETGISFFADEDRIQIITYTPTMVRSILRHAYAKIEWVYVHHVDERNERVSDTSEMLDVHDPDAIEGLKATLPVGVLSIKGSPRTNDRPSKIVVTPAEIAELGEVWDE